MNLPNKLVVARILLIPVFLYFMLAANVLHEWLFPAYDVPWFLFRLLALVAFLVAAFTDFLDGYLARRWNQVTNFGKLMDPLADKMMVCAALVALTFLQELSAWVVVVIISREFFVTALRQLALEKGSKVVAASLLGKAKTVTQITMVVMIMVGFGRQTPDIFAFPWLHMLTDVVIWVAVALTLLSAAEYAWQNRAAFKND